MEVDCLIHKQTLILVSLKRKVKLHLNLTFVKSLVLLIYKLLI